MNFRAKKKPVEKMPQKVAKVVKSEEVKIVEPKSAEVQLLEEIHIALKENNRTLNDSKRYLIAIAYILSKDLPDWDIESGKLLEKISEFRGKH